MNDSPTVDAVVIGSGPNGLAAAVTLARAGLQVHVFEAAAQPGGACRTETWGDGYRSDWGSAVHPMALASPFFTEMGLSDRVEFRVPEISVAHPLENDSALAWRSLDTTVADLGIDGAGWRTMIGGLVQHVDSVVPAALGASLHLPAHPADAARLATAALRARFTSGLSTEKGKALLAGIVAHSVGVQPRLGVSSAGVMLAALAHSVGWPIPVGGSGAITEALVEDLTGLGGEIHLGVEISRYEQLPRARAYFFDTAASTMLAVMEHRLTSRFARAIRRTRAGDAVSKVDLVLSSPIPWADSRIAGAGTVHVCGDQQDVRRAEYEVSRGRHSERPMIVLSQPSNFDPTRAEHGTHVVWAYAHVPAASDISQEGTILRSLERFAPGVRDTVIASRATSAHEIGQRNPAMPRGDFASGAITMRQILARPVLSTDPWRAGPGVYLCSGASAPGPGVHGMSGYGAARTALRDVFGAGGERKR